jgi:hypothetical protein
MPYSANAYVLIVLLVGTALGFLRRRHAIGGWLFYFFFATYAGLVSVLFTTRSDLRALDADNWPSTSQYHWYLVATLPVEALYFAIVIAATSLVLTRTERRLKILRGVLLLTLIVSIVCGTLIVFEPPLEILAISNFTIASSALFWSLYFLDSVRVKRVFVTHDWSEYPPVKHSSPSDTY